jgi:broad specificity phosphatase PhoE
VPRLRELKVSQIICSDLDGQSAEALSRRLNVPVEEWEALRRWNWGKIHGQYVANADAVRDRIADRTSPVKGGDSRASFEKRCAAVAERLRKLSGAYLLIVDEEVLEKLIGTSGAARYHVYEATLNGKSH